MQTAKLKYFKFTPSLPDWPLPIWLIIIALAIGLGSGLNTTQLISVFNTGWGNALGEFALILIPSFILAATLSQKDVGQAANFAAVASPFAAAGMVCPDTAYAALSSVAGRNRLSVAFGAYSGFKLLSPAGPLIVATGLGFSDLSVLITGLTLLLPVWGIGILWGRYAAHTANTTFEQPTMSGTLSRNLKPLAPFGLLGMLLLAGGTLDFSTLPVIDFFTKPKGALLLTASWALISVPSERRRECLDSALRRSASLLFVIGAASAFGAILIATIPISDHFSSLSGYVGIIGLFTLTVLFKLLQGSSMATFAAVAPIAAPLVATSDLPPVVAVYAICLGSFIAILPNDSFYWLVRKDALPNEKEASSAKLLAIGASLQALGGLALLLVLNLLEL